MVALREATEDEFHNLIINDTEFANELLLFDNPIVLKDIHSLTYFILEKEKVKTNEEDK